MKIAVLSQNGATVAPSISVARTAVVYTTAGNHLAGEEVRDLDAGGVLGEELLAELVDCQMVIAGSISPEEAMRFRRLGILALPVLPGERTEVAVRFVLNGDPPKEGDACGSCPNRAERVGPGIGAEALPADGLIPLLAMQQAATTDDASRLD